MFDTTSTPNHGTWWRTEKEREMEKARNKKEQDEEIKKNGQEAIEDKGDVDVLKEISKKSQRQVKEFFEKRAKLNSSSE